MLLERMEIRTIKVGEISPNPENPRKKMSEDELQELAQSIRSVGLLQPITVRPMVYVVEHRIFTSKPRGASG